MKAYRQKALISLMIRLIQLTFLVLTHLHSSDEENIPDTASRPIAFFMKCNNHPLLSMFNPKKNHVHANPSFHAELVGRLSHGSNRELDVTIQNANNGITPTART